MAREIAGDSAELILPHIQRRLAAEIIDGKAVTRVLDEDGSSSATSLEELKQSLLTNPLFAPVVIGSRATGGF